MIRSSSSTLPAEHPIRRPQLGAQQMLAAEDVQRQIAVIIVVAVEEPPFLVAVQRIVRGIQVQDDLARRLVMGLR